MNTQRRIAVVTGTRAEYGILYWLIRVVHEDPTLELQLLVTGSHLSERYGMTVQEIERDQFPIAAQIVILSGSDTELAIAEAISNATAGFAKEYERLRPDIIVVVGDRFEILAAVAAAAPFRIPVAHIHGGELTAGAIDELFRHAITKMSHLHFATTAQYRARIIQMCEDPERVFCVGAPGLDNINRLTLLTREQLYREFGIPAGSRFGVMTYHPVTLEPGSARLHIQEILKALDVFPDIFWVFTFPNAETESNIITNSIKAYVDQNSSRATLRSSLGQTQYLSLLKYASVMVGNSSSGLIEAPSFELPVVNISTRQDGRVRAKNVIDVPEVEYKKIKAAIQRALTPEFRARLRGLQNPYGDGQASEQILKVLKEISLGELLLKKRFRDIVNDYE